MAERPILKFPDPLLRQKTRKVTLPASAEVRELVKDMVDTMYAAHGAGLAAIQVGSDLRIFIVDGPVATGNDQAPPVVFVNPEMTSLSEETEVAEEGCLSFPGVYEPIKRSTRATCRAFDLEGKPFEVKGEALFARALQHEIDHIDGRLLIDMLGPVKREMVRRKMKRAAETGEYEEAHE